jgi:hypothetical protein
MTEITMDLLNRSLELLKAYGYTPGVISVDPEVMAVLRKEFIEAYRRVSNLPAGQMNSYQGIPIVRSNKMGVNLISITGNNYGFFSLDKYAANGHARMVVNLPELEDI